VDKRSGIYEKCMICRHCYRSAETNEAECHWHKEPEYNEENESWECELFEDHWGIMQDAIERRYEMLEEKGKDKAKHVSPD